MKCPVCEKEFSVDDGQICGNCAELVCDECCEAENSFAVLVLCRSCMASMTACAVCEFHFPSGEFTECPTCGKPVCSHCFDFHREECEGEERRREDEPVGERE